MYLCLDEFIHPTGLPIVDASIATIPILETTVLPLTQEWLVKWQSISNRTYVVQASSNYVDWVDDITPLVATGRISEVRIPLENTNTIRVITTD